MTMMMIMKNTNSSINKTHKNRIIIILIKKSRIILKTTVITKIKMMQPLNDMRYE